MGLLDIVRAAVPAAAAARGGYKLGQRQRAESDARERERQQDRKQRSIVEEIRLERERRLLQQATAPKEEETQLYDESEEGPVLVGKRSGVARPVTRPDGTPLKARTKPPTETPHFENTQRGIMRWDPKLGKLVPTGEQPYRAPREPKEGDTPEAKRKTLRDEIRENIAAVRGQQTDTQRKLGVEEQSLEPNDTAIKGLQTRLDSLGRVGDSLATELQRNSTPSGAPAPKAKTVITRDQASFLMNRKGWTQQQINQRYTVAP